MDRTYWHKQTDKPLFPELEWSRPENKAAAGKLLIVGGNAQAFAAPAEAFVESDKAGIGTSRVVLPMAVKRLAGALLDTVEYAISNPSGGFSQMALTDLLDWASWADGVLLAGDFGRNSETAILLEKFLDKYSGQVTLTKDAVDYFTPSPQQLLVRGSTTFVVSFAQLQKLAINAHFTKAFTFGMDFLRLIDSLHEFTQAHPINIVVKHLDNIFVAVGGEVSSTKLVTDIEIWRIKTAAHTATWWLQIPNKPFEALTTSLVATND